MQPSKVFFTNMRALEGESMLDKLQRLMKKGGFDTIDFEKKFVAIKIHFGEPGNLAFLRPNYAKTVATMVRERGGQPFLTDCNTLYPGRRKNALEHLDAAMENGFFPLSTGCQLIIADGLKGTDEVLVPLTGTDFVKEAKIGHAIMDADIIVSLNHFKGHEGAGFGGAIKNIGMGCGSRAGKMEQHNEGKPQVIESKCRGCRLCARSCAQSAISYGADGKASIDHGKCVGCGRCIGACNFDAIRNRSGSDNEIFNRKMAEYALAVLQGRPNFHINVITQVSPYCDCYGGNDLPIIPDIGIFCSFDPVALDQACADACNAQTPIKGSLLDEAMHDHAPKAHDHFGTMFPDTSWQSCLDQSEKIGIGTRQYELVTVK